MTDVQCPVCKSANHQSFWHWEKEDQLMREWAMDTRVHFSICRECALIFQNPIVDRSSQGDLFSDGWETGAEPPPPSQEPLEWLRQFTGYAKEPGRALEIYSKKKRFESQLKEEGWAVKTISLDRLLQESDTKETQTQESPTGVSEKVSDPFLVENPFFDTEKTEDASPENTTAESPPDDTSSLPMDDPFFQSEKPVMNAGLEEDDQFDIVFCFDALGQTTQPLEVLNKIHPHIKDEGVIYVEVENPAVNPRVNRLCLKSEERCAFPFHSLIFTLFKAGFMNASAELCGRIRCVGKKIEPNPKVEAVGSVPNEVWSYALHRFQRNYDWMLVNKFLEQYQNQAQLNNNDLLERTRTQIRQNTWELSRIRDVCGAALLFVEEVSALRNTLAKDWPVTMNRIFEVFKQDFALYELLLRGVLQNLGTFYDAERYHYNDKMVYMTNTEYFEKYFSEEEARRLCDSIVEAGKIVVGHLSSFL